MFCQIATKATAGGASDGSVSHSILTPSTWFNAPAEGWKIHFHTTPSARGALTQGITTTTRTRAEPGTARTSWVASPSPSASDTGTEISVKIAVTSSEFVSAPPAIRVVYLSR